MLESSELIKELKIEMEYVDDVPRCGNCSYFNNELCFYNNIGEMPVNKQGW